MNLQRKDGCFLHGYSEKNNLISQYVYHYKLMIDLLYSSSKSTGIFIKEAVVKGLILYKETFFLFRNIPLSISKKISYRHHNQAQDIITLSKFEIFMLPNL